MRHMFAAIFLGSHSGWQAVRASTCRIRAICARSQILPGSLSNRSCQYCFTSKPGKSIGGFIRQTRSGLAIAAAREGTVRVRVDRESVGEGKSVVVRVDLGGSRQLKKQKEHI